MQIPRVAFRETWSHRPDVEETAGLIVPSSWTYVDGVRAAAKDTCEAVGDFGERVPGDVWVEAYENFELLHLAYACLTNPTDVEAAWLDHLPGGKAMKEQAVARALTPDGLRLVNDELLNMRKATDPTTQPAEAPEILAYVKHLRKSHLAALKARERAEILRAITRANALFARHFGGE